MLERMDELEHGDRKLHRRNNLCRSQLPRQNSILGGATAIRVTLIFIRLPSAAEAVNRVRKRIAAGGHGIPEDTIRRRFTLGLENLEKHYKSAVDEWYICESLEGTYRLVGSWNER